MKDPKFQIISTYKSTKADSTLKVMIPYWASEEFVTMGEAETCLRKNATSGLKYLIVPIWDGEDIEFPKIKCSSKKILKL